MGRFVDDGWESVIRPSSLGITASFGRNTLLFGELLDVDVFFPFCLIRNALIVQRVSERLRWGSPDDEERFYEPNFPSVWIVWSCMGREVVEDNGHLRLFLSDSLFFINSSAIFRNEGVSRPKRRQLLAE